MSTMTVGTKRPKKNIAYGGKSYGGISVFAAILSLRSKQPVLNGKPTSA